MRDDDDEVLLGKLAPEARKRLLLRWADRAVREVAVGLLDLAGEDAGSQRLRALPPVDSPAALHGAVEAMFAVVERAAEGWQATIDAARTQADDWQQVLGALGPTQVTQWSAYVVLLEDLGSVDERAADPGVAFEVALLLRNAAAALAELRAGGPRTAALSVAEAVADAEQRRQRREILDLLPS